MVTEFSGKDDHPVLNYATIDADGLPQFMPEVEVLIEAGNSVKAIRHLFRRTEHAVKYFAKSMTRRYGETNLEECCFACRSTKPMYVVQLKWNAKTKFRFAELRLAASEPEAQFVTLHAICRPCLADWFSRIYRHARLRQLLGMTMLVGIFVWIFGSVFDRIIRINNLKLSIAVMAMPLLAALALKLTNRSVYKRYPTFMIDMMAKGVQLLGISCIFVRENGKLLEIHELHEPASG